MRGAGSDCLRFPQNRRLGEGNTMLLYFGDFAQMFGISFCRRGGAMGTHPA